MEKTAFGFEFHIVAIEIANYMMMENVEWKQAVEDKCVPEDVVHCMCLLEAQTNWYLQNATSCE